MLNTSSLNNTLPYSAAALVSPQRAVPVMALNSAAFNKASTASLSTASTGSSLPTNIMSGLPSSPVLPSALTVDAVTSATTPTSFSHTVLPQPLEADSPALQKVADEAKKQKRTPGLKAFDALLYPLLANFLVFGASVFFTYKSTYGHPEAFLMKRGEETRKLFKAVGFDTGSARSAAMLAWSFLDGCIAAPFVKLLEDKRTPISKKLDQWMGTTPKDSKVYEEEPVQSWKSVLSGRFVASLSIVPMWNLLEQKWGGAHKLNEVLFYRPGERLAESLKKNVPSVLKVIQKIIPQDKVPKMLGVVLFEGFYTAVTTTALYFASRGFAGLDKNKPAPLFPAVSPQPPVWAAPLARPALASSGFGVNG